MNFFEFDFFIQSLLAGSIISIIAPMIGVFLVVRRYSLIADTLSHVALAGASIGLLFKTESMITAMISTVLASLGLDFLRQRKKFFGDSGLALLLFGSLAIASLLLSQTKGGAVNIMGLFFGSIATISRTDLAIVFFLGIVVSSVIIFFYRKFFIISFDEDLARVQGINVSSLNILFMALTAATISVSLRVVGVLLIGALMVIPVVTALLFQKSFRTTNIISIALSFFAVIFGLFLSFLWNVPSGGAIVLVLLFFFFVSLLWTSN